MEEYQIRKSRENRRPSENSDRKFGTIRSFYSPRYSPSTSDPLSDGFSPLNISFTRSWFPDLSRIWTDPLSVLLGARRTTSTWRSFPVFHEKPWGLLQFSATCHHSSGALRSSWIFPPPEIPSHKRFYYYLGRLRVWGVGLENQSLRFSIGRRPSGEFNVARPVGLVQPIHVI